MEKTEAWKQIIINGEAWDYEVSDMGNVRRIGSSKCLKVCDNGCGYLRISLSKNGKVKTFYVHRLVAIMFIPNSQNLKEVNHINEIKTDNRAENLEWCNRAYNCNYGTRTKRQKKTMRGKRSKKVMGISLTENKVIVFQSTQQGEKFGFSQSKISDCCNGYRKSHRGYAWKYI